MSSALGRRQERPLALAHLQLTLQHPELSTCFFTNTLSSTQSLVLPQSLKTTATMGSAHDPGMGRLEELQLQKELKEVIHGTLFLARALLLPHCSMSRSTDSATEYIQNPVSYTHL